MCNYILEESCVIYRSELAYMQLSCLSIDEM